MAASLAGHCALLLALTLAAPPFRVYSDSLVLRFRVETVSLRGGATGPVRLPRAHSRATRRAPPASHLRAPRQVDPLPAAVAEALPVVAIATDEEATRARAESEAPSDAVSKVHADGEFDFVIWDPHPPVDGPGGRALLRCSPVGTVYIAPGESQEWVLRYCVPAPAVRARPNQLVIELDVPAMGTPPYPRLTVVPRTAPASDRVLLVHGFLTAEGGFRALQPVRVADAEVLSAIEPYLQQWRFRPAMRSGVPVESEVLLVVPTR